MSKEAKKKIKEFKPFEVKKLDSLKGGRMVEWCVTVYPDKPNHHSDAEYNA